MSKMLIYTIILGILCHLIDARIFGILSKLLKVEDFNELVDIISNNKLGEYRMLPFTNADVSQYVKFNLYTRENPKNEHVLEIGKSEIKFLNPEIPTKVIIHGWLDNLKRIWINDMRDAYLRNGNYNIIVVDWSPLAWREYFSTAAPSTRSVGQEVGRLLKYLESNKFLSLRKIHLIGYSLGGHIAGFAGAFLSGKVGRITGLDPAGPAFEVPSLVNVNERLDPSDAIFVDVIHTGGGGFGFTQPIGHVDFFPNGGVGRQPGCSIINTVYCSHHRAPEFMVESIKDRTGFIARKCLNWKMFKQGKCSNNEKAFMGEYATSDLRGSFFLEIN